MNLESKLNQVLTEIGTDIKNLQAGGGGGGGGGTTVHISPADFGAVGDGSTDDTAALQAMIDSLVHLNDRAATYNNIGPRVVDFEGKSYLISAPLRVGSMGGTNRVIHQVQFQNGKLIASAAGAWTGEVSTGVPNSFMVLVCDEDPAFVKETNIGLYRVGFVNVQLRCQFATGGILFRNTDSCYVEKLRVEEMAKNGKGIATSGQTNGALMIDDCFVQGFEETSGGTYPAGEDQDTMNTRALEIQTNDARVNDFICCKVTCSIWIDNCGAVQFDNCHPWAKLVYLGPNAKRMMFSNCYFDYTTIHLDGSFKHFFEGCHLLLGGAERWLRLTAHQANETGDEFRWSGYVNGDLNNGPSGGVLHDTSGAGSWAADKDRTYHLDITTEEAGWVNVPTPWRKGKFAWIDNTGKVSFKSTDAAKGITTINGNYVTVGDQRGTDGGSGVIFNNRADGTTQASIQQWASGKLVLDAPADIRMEVNGGLYFETDVANTSIKFPATIAGTGATFTAAVTGIDPTLPQHFATKAYVDANGGGGGGGSSFTTPVTVTPADTTKGVATLSGNILTLGENRTTDGLSGIYLTHTSGNAVASIETYASGQTEINSPDDFKVHVGGLEYMRIFHDAADTAARRTYFVHRTRVGAPTETDDAATKGYVDSAVAGVSGGGGESYTATNSDVTKGVGTFTSNVLTLGSSRTTDGLAGIYLLHDDLGTGTKMETFATGNFTVDTQGDMTFAVNGGQYLKTDKARATLVSVAKLEAPSIALTGTGGTNKITNVANPTASTDVANKAYVDAQAGGSWNGNATSALDMNNYDILDAKSLSTNGYLTTGSGATIGGYLTNQGGASFAGNVTLGGYNLTNLGLLSAFGLTGNIDMNQYRVADLPATPAFLNDAASRSYVDSKTSDERLKMDIQDAEPMLDKIMSLQAKRYSHRDAHESYLEGPQIGLIAQAVREVFPEVIREKDDLEIYDLETGEFRTIDTPMGIDYRMLVVPLIKAVQELTEKVRKLEAGA